MTRRIYLFSFLLFLSTGFLKAQNNYQFSHLDINSGLSHNNVTCILKDSKGFMWFGTLSGLNRFDGYNFKIFKHAANDSTSLTDDYIVSISEGPQHKLWVETRNGFNIYDAEQEKFSHDIKGYLHSVAIPDIYVAAVKKDRSGYFWFLHSTQGLFKYNPATGKTIHLTHLPSDSSSISSNVIADLAQDSRGNIWLAYRSGILERMNSATLRVNYRAHFFNKLPGELNTSYKIYIDNDDDIWAFVPTYSAGVYYINPQKGLVHHLTKGNDDAHLNTDIVSSVIQDTKGRMWIATDHGGINLLNKSDFKIQHILSREDDSKTIGQNSITILYKDITGIIWVGTYKKGVDYYHESIIKFPLCTHHLADPLNDPRSLNFSDINSFAEDAKGNLWLGTNGGGLIYFNREKETFKTYHHQNSSANSLANDVIVCLYMDHSQKLWIGTYFGGLDCFDGKTFRHFRHNEKEAGSISEDRICSITEDSKNRLLVGTLSAGVNIMNSDSKAFSHIMSSPVPNAIHSNYISKLLADKHNNIWVVTSYGVDVLMNKTHRFVHFIHDEKNKNSLVNNNTNNILEDKDGLIWISTRGGISIYNPATFTFTNINKEDGLPDNTVNDMQEYDSNNVWVSTPNGLSNITISRDQKKLKFHFTSYTDKEGLQGREFNENSSLKTREGELVFGGGNGFNVFRPGDVHFVRNTPKLVFTDFQIFNKSLHAGDKVNGRVILPGAINDLRSVTLNYNDNVFSLEFAALDYFDPGNVQFEYMMKGFDSEWIPASNKVRKATYTNLDPGTYFFKVRASNSGSFPDKELQLTLTILPPFWKTNLAYLLYVLTIAGGLFIIRARGIKKLRAQFLIEREREEAHRMHELDLMKIKFFTNVSHEFRTPLSLILAPVEKTLKQTIEPEMKRQLLMVNRNAKRLLNLFNQLLDFRKMEYQELRLQEKDGEIVSFIKEIAYAFTDIADQKNIRFVFDSEIDLLYSRFDHDKMERILFNLLSNAYKFTPEGGQVSVLLNRSSESDQEKLEIRVIDDGIGISGDKLEKIFEPFFQNEVPGYVLNQGSGIGLSITKEFVRLHNGEITVESEPNNGSCFTVLLPVTKLDDRILMDAQISLTHGPQYSTVENFHKNKSCKDESDFKKATILLVEDNHDFRFYIKDNLKSKFNILEAENGKRGWQKALAMHPDLIVSDISMPEMNGIDLCKKIKNDPRTSHIPVILLTALTGEEQQLQGLETGASDYMTKPFNFEILQSKIANILEQQITMRKTYQKQVEVAPSKLMVDSPDEIFKRKVLTLIDSNIDNPNFSVEELSSDMCVSRYTLYKRILAMTGKTPNEFVRSMRIKRAAQLLETGNLTISQVCSKVGFKSQKYFVKSFKAAYNTIPSKYGDTMEADV